MTWEYITILFVTSGIFRSGRLDGDAFNAKLNEFGEQGWELVSVFCTTNEDGATRDVTAVFKRPGR